MFVEVEAAFPWREFLHKSHRPHPRGDSTVMRQVLNGSSHVPELRQIARYLDVEGGSSGLYEISVDAASGVH